MIRGYTGRVTKQITCRPVYSARDGGVLAVTRPTGDPNRRGARTKAESTGEAPPLTYAQSIEASGSRANARLVPPPPVTLQRRMTYGVPDEKALDSRRSMAMLLAAVAKRRDRGAFVRLFEHFGPRVKAYLMRLGADPETAQDVVQDVMLTVWHRAEQYDSRKASPSTWIFTIARNRRIDLIRRERRPELDPDDPALVRAPETPADQTIEAAEQTVRLRAAIAELPEEQAHLLRLAFFQEASHSRIAGEFGLPLGTVKSRLRLAMAKLRTALKEVN